MILRRLAFIKHIVYSLLALVALLCAAEVSLRVYSNYQKHGLVDGGGENGLLIESWGTHHCLKPLQTYIGENPDTKAPVLLVTNSYGLRGRDPQVPKSPDVYRIICLGDEMTLAATVEESETFCAQLEALLQPQTRLKVEVINAGIPGYCPLLSYLQLKHSLLALQPDLLIVNFDMSDVADDHRYRRHTRMGEAAIPLACPSVDLALRQTQPRFSIWNQSMIVKWFRCQLGPVSDEGENSEDRGDIDAAEGCYAWLRDDPPDWSIYVRQALDPIEQMDAMAQRTYARLIVATYPLPWQVSAKATPGGNARRKSGVSANAVYRSRRPFETIARFAHERNISFCDTSKAFAQSENPERLFLRNSSQFSQSGHERYAQELARYILQTVPGLWETGGSGRRGRMTSRRRLELVR